jgi:hypothetical protein
MKFTKIKKEVLDYLKYERDERIPELIEAYDGDKQYVIDEIWGPLETILDNYSDQDLINLVNNIMDGKNYNLKFKEWKDYNNDEDDLISLHCTLVWEMICNPE